MNNQFINRIERYYNIELTQILEDEKSYSQVEFYKNSNTYSVDSSGQVIKINLKDNYIDNLNIFRDLKGLHKSLTHINIAANRIRDISQLSYFENLKFLDAGTNLITDLSPLLNLKNLEYLYLDNNQITDIPKFEFPELAELWLYSNKIKDIKGLGFLEKLYVLNISNNNLNDISVISSIPGLKNINLSKNNIDDISAFINFKDVNVLNLSNNQIVNIQFLKGISVQEELLLGQNKIYDLSPLYQGLKGEKIKFVNAFDNPLIYPPQKVILNGESFIVEWFDNIYSEVNKKIDDNKQAENTKLDLGKMGITDLSLFPKLFKLNHLEELILSNEWAEYDNKHSRWLRIESINKGLKNNIFHVPREITKLSKLKRLTLGGDWKSKNDKSYNPWRLKSVEFLSKLKQLKYINISNNQINKVDFLNSLSEIEIAHLNNNLITNLPDLKSLKKLKEIYLSNNYIKDIGFLNECYDIQTVDLHSNEISDLLPFEDLLKKSRNNIKIKDSSWEKNGISISKNSSSIVPPYEVIRQSNQGFFLYIKQKKYEDVLQLDPYHNREIKIILVGNSSAGKSTLLNFIKTKRFKKNLPVTHWLVTEEMHNFKIDKKIFKLRFFDFGGHDYYHDTHKIFFSSDSVYLLLWDNGSNFLGEIDDPRNSSYGKIQVFPLEYWLDAIEIYAKKKQSQSQIQMELLLREKDKNMKLSIKNNGDWINHILSTDVSDDTIQKNVLVVQNKIDLNQGFLDQYKNVKKYSNISDFINLSISKNIGKKNFQEHFLNIVRKNLNYNKPLLASWGYIKDNWSKIFIGDDFVIDLNLFRQRINSFLRQWLVNVKQKTAQQAGNILFDEEDILLFANFLNEIGLVIFTTNEQKSNGNIIVHPNIFLTEVYKLLEVAKLTGGTFYKDAIRNINYSELIVTTLVSHKIIFKAKGNCDFIAPLYLPENPSFLIGLLTNVKIPFRRFRFKGFIPKGIILSIFSEIIYEQDISEEDFYYWKKGLIFKDKITSQKIFLKFSVRYDLGYAFIDIFNLDDSCDDKYLKEITNTIKKVIENEGITSDELLTLDGIFFADIDDVVFNYENKINFIDIFDSNEKTKRQINVYSFNKLLDDSMKKPTKKIFISYSKQDLGLVNKFIEHLTALQRDGKVSHWYCSELEAGSVWNAEIQTHFEESDIICFMVSPNFMKTDYIYEHEIKKAFERKSMDSDFKIVPIILNFCRWTTANNNLGDFTALPYTAKPIVDFNNQDMGWYIVVECLRLMIDNNLNPTGDDFYSKQPLPPDIIKIYERIVKGKVDNNSI